MIIYVESVSKTKSFPKNSFLKGFLKIENKELQEIIEIEIENSERVVIKIQEQGALAFRKEKRTRRFI